jgi:hypothetical protein
MTQSPWSSFPYNYASQFGKQWPGQSGFTMIADSPDTEVVRKYWYQSGASNQFTLIDESGNLMTYQRTR